MNDRSWSNYPVGKVERAVPPMPDAERGCDPELGPYWEFVTSMRHELDRRGYWMRRTITLVRHYDRGITETVTREHTTRG
jgi:hypothetical protein